MNMLHPERKIDRYLAGDTRGERALRAHLARCDRCRQHYDAGVLALRAARGSFVEPGAGELERLIRRAGELPERRVLTRTRHVSSGALESHAAR